MSANKTHIAYLLYKNKQPCCEIMFLLNSLFFGRLFILTTFHCASIFNGFHPWGNVLDFWCVCYFTWINMFLSMYYVWRSGCDLQIFCTMLSHHAFFIPTGERYYICMLRYIHIYCGHQPHWRLVWYWISFK